MSRIVRMSRTGRMSWTGPGRPSAALSPDHVAAQCPLLRNPMATAPHQHM